MNTDLLLKLVHIYHRYEFDMAIKNAREKQKAYDIGKLDFSDHDHFFPLTILGLSLCLVAIFGNWYGEHKFGQEIRLINKIRSHVTVVGDKLNSKNENRLVLVSARLASNEKIGDSYLKEGNYLRLSRSIETYPWSPYANPKTEEVARVKSATFGEFDAKDLLPYIFSSQYDDKLLVTENMLKDSSFQVFEQFIYKRQRIGRDTKGDKRLKYSALHHKAFTVVGWQKKNKLQPLESGSTKKFLIAPGIVKISKFFQAAEEQNKFYLYIIRLYTFGFFLLGMTAYLLPFRGIFKTWSFLSASPRFLPFFTTFALYGLLSGAIKNFPNIITLILAVGLFLAFMIYFIFINRETPASSSKS